MSIAILLKIFSDCCICFAILGSGPVSFGLSLLIPGVLCGIAAGIAAFFQEKGWTIPRRLCGLLPLLCLLLAGDFHQMLVLAVPVLYTTMVILRGKLELEYYSYRRSFLQSLALLGAAYLIVNIWIFLAGATGDSPPELDSGVILRYGLIHLFCGIVLQRQLRLGVGYRSDGGRQQMSMLLLTIGMIVFAFVFAEPLLRQHAATLIKFLLTVMMTPILLLVELFKWVISLFERKQTVDPTETVSVDVSGEGAVSSGGEKLEQVTKPPLENSPDPALVWLALVTVLLLIAAVVLYRSFQKRRAAGDPGEILGRVVAVPKLKKEPALSNRSKVRQLYRDFLKREKAYGMKLRLCDTSLDVLQRIHPETDSGSADALRQVYLAARYDERQNISRSQLNTAKNALKGTRSPKK